MFNCFGSRLTHRYSVDCRGYGSAFGSVRIRIIFCRIRPLQTIVLNLNNNKNENENSPEFPSLGGRIYPYLDWKKSCGTKLIRIIYIWIRHAGYGTPVVNGCNRPEHGREEGPAYQEQHPVAGSAAIHTKYQEFFLVLNSVRWGRNNHSPQHGTP